MRELVLEVISSAAAAAGLTIPTTEAVQNSEQESAATHESTAESGAERQNESSTATPAAATIPVMFAAKKDNITLPLPRIEVSLGNCAYERSGRRLGFLVSLDECSIKRELYRIIQKVTVTLLSDDESFLAMAVPALIKKLPRGLNDNQGNWVKILVKSGGHAGYEVPKVSETPIDPLPKRRETLELEFTGRLTTLEPVEFINNFNISANRGEENG